MSINCLIVDDEPLSQEVLVDFINDCPELSLSGVCKNALEAGEILAAENIDVLFLDINMPKLSGIDFIKSLAKPPLFVFVTAYPEFALEGFEVDAVDYLVKPVSFERFRKSVNRILERLPSAIEKEREHILLRADKKNYRLGFNEIMYLEAQGDYVKFVTAENSLMVHGTLKDFTEQLPENEFARIHKSYVVSISKIVYVEGNSVKVDDVKLPVSLNYKDILIEKLA